MTHEIDLGVRCDKHTGEVFPPRCYDCQTLATELHEQPRVGFIPGTECKKHPGYPLTSPAGRCERCIRDEEEGVGMTDTLRRSA